MARCYVSRFAVPLLCHASQRPHIALISHATRFNVCRALYSKQIGALLGGGAGKNLPNMRNLAMELRKLCCHPVSVCVCSKEGVRLISPLDLPKSRFIALLPH